MLKKFLIGTFALALVLSVGAMTADAFSGATLKQGSKGADVMELQTKLGLTADGSFGPMTKAALMAFQASNGLTADGVAGPMTLAKLTGTAVVGTYPAGCTSTVGFSSTTGLSCAGTVSTYPAGCTSSVGFSSTTGLSCAGTVSTYPAGCSSSLGYSSTTGAKCDGTTGGTTTSTELTGLGELSDVSQLSSYSNEEVGADTKDTKVLGFEVKASKDGDIGLKSTKVSFVISNASGSTKLADYVDTVSIWKGSTKVGSVSSDDFNKDSTGHYSKKITLSNAVVLSDKTEKFYVTVDALSNLDSGDIDTEIASISLDNIQYTDGSGITTTDAETGDLTAGVTSSISFVDFSSAANTELKISTSNTPVANTVKVSTTANTDGIVLLKGKLKLDGTSNVWLDEMPITFTTTGDSVRALTGSVTLTLGTDNTYTESVTEATQSGTVTFNNLDYTIDAGSTVNFTVSADLNDLENTGLAATDFDESDSLKAELTTTNRASIIAENSVGDQLANTTEMSGSSLGEAQTFRSSGLSVELVGTPTFTVVKGLTTKPDVGTATITFDVTAFGGDMYIDGTKPTLTGTDSTTLTIIPGTGGTGTQDATITSSTGATRTGTINTTARFYVAESTTERFTITSVVTPTVAGGLYSVALSSLAYATSDVDVTDALPALEYTTNLTDFTTPSGNLVLVN